MSVQLTRVESAAVVTLDRPKALNALSFAVLEELDRALDEVARSDAIGKRGRGPAIADSSSQAMAVAQTASFWNRRRLR